MPGARRSAAILCIRYLLATNTGVTVNLPLLENAKNGTLPVGWLPNLDSRAAEDRCGRGSEWPDRLPGEGEQYRFHFDMTRCIGCECCVVACNEQNGNPPDIHWRRVGEIEGGTYPETLRLYLSMGCNHCLEPSCLEGCPVDAYSKDPLTGIVLHNAERCIGCQYCTWNCSYGVPQYNPERGVVGKCDMCYGRLAHGQAPACADACPEQAIGIEIVKIDEWRAGYTHAANAPGLPSADDSVSTTRITLPVRIPTDTRNADASRLRPEQPHWPLVFMTVLTQTSVGAFGALIFEGLAMPAHALRRAAMGSLVVAALALAASTAHLGRPAYAWRALRMWRRSWLSREVLLFTLFAGLGTACALSLWWNRTGSPVLAICTGLSGVAGVLASARIYCVRARPAWNSGHTTAEFLLSGLLTGPIFAAGFIPQAGNSLLVLAAMAACCALLQQMAKLLWLANAEANELRSTARLLSSRLRPWLLARMVALLALATLLPHVRSGVAIAVLALIFAVATEIVGRWLFFVGVVPKNMASSYLQEAA
jgi:formate dehydrogenase iron-sulfur subunit